MALNSSGPISLGGATQGQSVNLELGAGASSTISFNDTDVRTLTGTASLSTLVMPQNFWGASTGTVISYMTIAGGGGGQSAIASTAGGGGGGAGGYTTGLFTAPNDSIITVTIGTGGAAGAQGTNTTVSGTGITTVTAVGGGYGGSGNGGSGGGAGGATIAAGGFATAGQGYVGGTTVGGGGGAGGGGAATLGGDSDGYAGGNGGAGASTSISGSSVTYGGGGGGGGGVTPYNISNSLRFRSSVSAYLNRTATAGNRKTWTWSGWVKRGLLNTSASGKFFGAGSSGSSNTGFQMGFGNESSNSDTIYIQQSTWAVSNAMVLETNAVYRDPSAWYHIVLAVDTTQATDTNRVKLYVNGVQVTSFNGPSYPSQNTDLLINNSGTAQYLGSAAGYSGQRYFDGYLAEVNFIDGQALAPTAFGYNNGVTGVWQPVQYTGTYGTNGFYLPFNSPAANNTSTYAATLSGSGQYLQFPNSSNFAFGTGAFTIEFWINGASNNDKFILGGRNAVGTMHITTGGFDGSTVGALRYVGSSTIVTNDVITDNSYHHCAIVRDGSNNVRLYVDGALAGSGTDSTNYSTTSGTWYIGTNDTSAGNNLLTASISNMRIVKGTAVYTSNFIPPASPLTAISGTSLLTLQSSTVTDNSGNSVTISNTGSVATTPAYPFVTNVAADASGNSNNWVSVNISLAPTVLSFTSSTTWTAPPGVTSVNYLVVAGGGGGGSAATGISMGGGGGAGGLLLGKQTVVPGTAYTITVGSGGAALTNGGNSVFGPITATGGGAGAGGTSSFIYAQNGGSGGGGGPYSALQKGSGIAGQGYDGGSAGNVNVGGGGGGSGGVGGSAPTGTVAGAGGPGTVSLISGSAVTYAGGGGGGAYIGETAGAGGSGGGGAGGSNANGSNATGYGSGGGGAGQYGNTNTGGSGSSGIVILQYGGSATYDSMTDVPTLTSATATNYAVLNPLQSYYTPTNSNLSVSTGANATGLSFSSIGLGTGSKFYFEATATGANQQIGIFSSTQPLTPTGSKRYWYVESGGLYNDSSLVQSVATFTNGDTIAVAWDGVAQTVTFYKNNTQQGTAISVDTTYQYFFGVGVYNGGWNVNFGQRSFQYAPPTGYSALNAYNLPAPTILAGNKYMNATLWTGNGSTQQITNAAGFRPDFVWLKIRSAEGSHRLLDSVRGATNALASNLTNAEFVDPTGLTAFNSNGFTLGSDGSYNGSGSTYVGWQWQAGQGVTSTNTSGTITSTVGVNTTAGFSVVTYTGTGANATVGHGLGVAPQLVIVKNRTTSARFWTVYHQVLGNAQYLQLDSVNAAATSAAAWNNTSPTSSVFTIGTGNTVNSTDSYVAYCWTPIAGYSTFGSYTGNGSANGPFVYTGFRPKFVMIKVTSTSGVDTNWNMIDTTRSPSNVVTAYLNADQLAAEGSYAGWDILSNGFKLRNTGISLNSSGQTYVYAAFAENPFKCALAR